MPVAFSVAATMETLAPVCRPLRSYAAIAEAYCHMARSGYPVLAKLAENKAPGV